jgi:predicted RNA-binding Zn-ribbon protein involved in translation (DUF1610 family)
MTPLEMPKKCPKCGENMALSTESFVLPRYVDEKTAKAKGGQAAVDALAGGNPIEAHHCPKCGLVELYG